VAKKNVPAARAAMLAHLEEMARLYIQAQDKQKDQIAKGEESRV
jgi:hypothetical protein